MHEFISMQNYHNNTEAFVENKDGWFSDLTGELNYQTPPGATCQGFVWPVYTPHREDKQRPLPGMTHTHTRNPKYGTVLR